MSSYIEYYDKLVAAEELPTALQLQTLTVELPNLGVVFAVLAVWTDPDEEEGRQWIKKIASAAPCIMDSAESVTIPDFLANNEKLVTWPSYGRAYTASVKRLTPKTMKVLAKYSQVAPGGSLAISVHSLRSPKPNEASVFGSRTDHHVLEIIAMVTDPALQAEREAWAMRLKEELIAQDPDNILEGSYISLGSDADTDLKKVYGPHYNRLMELKTKYDAGNVFKYAVPRLFQIGPEDSA